MAPRRRSSARSKTTVAPTEAPVPTISEQADVTVASAPEAMDASSEMAAGQIAVPFTSQDEVAQLAYSYWLERGCQGGSPEEDWLRAEEEVRRRRQVA
jgi:hypothetical protein